MMTKVFIALIIGVFLGAIVHELDIGQTCKRLGNDNYAGWVININCSERKP